MKNIISYDKYTKIYESKYTENVLIYLDISNNSCYLKSIFYDQELNSKLINLVLKKLGITNNSKLGKYKISINDVERLIKILESLNLTKSNTISSTGRLIFKGTITIKDIKKIKVDD